MEYINISTKSNPKITRKRITRKFTVIIDYTSDAFYDFLDYGVDVGGSFPPPHTLKIMAEAQTRLSIEEEFFRYHTHDFYRFAHKYFRRKL